MPGGLTFVREPPQGENRNVQEELIVTSLQAYQRQGEATPMVWFVKIKGDFVASTNNLISILDY